eukprot:12056016-Prorocentrum_lima.AAC.1
MATTNIVAVQSLTWCLQDRSFWLQWAAVQHILEDPTRLHKWCKGCECHSATDEGCETCP